MHPCRRLRQIGILVLATSGLFFGLLGPIAAAPLDEDVRRLVNELDAPSRRERSAARDALIGLGPRVLPLLPDEKTISSAAVREALLQIRDQLKRSAALTTLAPSRVTLQATLPLRLILESISRQTGNAIDASSLGSELVDQRLRVDFQSRPFWTACDEIVNRVGLRYGNAAKRGTLQLIHPDGNKRDTDLALNAKGFARVGVRSAVLRSLVENSRPRLLRINWDFLVEPRLRPLFARIDTNDLIVMDARGRRLEPLSPGATLELPLGEGGQLVRIDTDFIVPADWIPSDVSYRGTLHVEMAAVPERVAFHQLIAPPRHAHRVGAATVVLNRAHFAAQPASRDSARLDVSILYNRGGPAFDSFRNWAVHNQAYLEEKGGQIVKPREVVLLRQQDDGTLEMQYNFGDVGPAADYQFVCIVPTLVTNVPAPFHFSRIPVAHPVEGIPR